MHAEKAARQSQTGEIRDKPTTQIRTCRPYTDELRRFFRLLLYRKTTTECPLTTRSCQGG
jgi:hypothetical protein